MAICIDLLFPYHLVSCIILSTSHINHRKHSERDLAKIRNVCRIHLQYLQAGVRDQRAPAGPYAYGLSVSLYLVHPIRVVFNHPSGYNLKRKIASLAPISADVFDRTTIKSQDGVNSPAKPGEAEEASSSNTQLHQIATERDHTPMQCLFCSIRSATMDDNVEHMSKFHGLFLPYQEELEDAEGLLSYLFNIISEFHECLYCGKTKETIEGIRSHMIDKGHCKIALEDELDQFYDFKGGSEASSEDETIRDEKHEDVNKSLPPLEHDFHPDSDHELRLPSGRILGHRSLSRYYRQNLHSYPTPAERAANRAITAADDADGGSPMPDHPGRQIATMARGEMGMIGVSDFEKRALRATEKKALKQETRAKNQHEWRVNKESNHQKHYRVSGPSVLHRCQADSHSLLSQDHRMAEMSFLDHD